MPITPGHQWQDNEAWISIDVKIPNVTTTSADVIITDCYVKVNSTPYFFEADLYREVDSKASKASVGLGAIKFFLLKKGKGLWERLSIQGDKNMRLQRRQLSMEAIREERERIRKEYRAKFSNIGRLAVGDQMRMEESKRKIIEKRKEEEQLIEQNSIESWKEENSQTHWRGKNWNKAHLEEIHDISIPSTKSLACKNSNIGEKLMQCKYQTSSFLAETHIAKDLRSVKNKGDNSIANYQNLDDRGVTNDDSKVNDEQIFNPNEDLQNFPPTPIAYDSNIRNCVDVRKPEVIPAPRNCATVPIAFSPKPNLPKNLPARESRDTEIKLKRSEKASEDTLDVSERAPLFLQDKGDKFFKAGDYQSAINAYTDALGRDSSLVMSLVNRGSCKLHLKEFKACVQDCTSALCILTKGTPDCAKETILAQNFLVQESILAQNSLIPSQACDTSSSSNDAVHCNDGAKDLGSNGHSIIFPVESLELLTCLSGQGCCSMRGLIVEGAGVEEWKVSIKKHMHIRRGVAQYYLGDASKAIDDFTKVVEMKCSNEELERILKDLRIAHKTMNK